MIDKNWPILSGNKNQQTNADQFFHVILPIFCLKMHIK